jgi:hypothetical protein
MATHRSVSHQPVQLILPAEAGSVRLARLVATGVATDAGLSIDDTEDLRVAVSELVALLIDGLDDPVEIATLTYRHADGEVEVAGECSFVASHPAKPPVDDLALEILRVVVDDHSFTADDDVRRFHLVKRARAAT